MAGTNSRDADRGGIQVIARAGAILRALEAEPDGLSLGALAARVGLARSTVQRIVGALIDEQMLISAGPRGGVALGPALVRFAAAANVETDRLCRPALQALSRETGETVDLSTLQGRTAVFVDQITGSRRLVAISAVGATFPLHCTANGKALLASLDPARAAQLVRDKLTRHTANTITSLPALMVELEAIRVRGVAIDREEHSDGICAVGCAFTDHLGRAFAISIPVPTARFEQVGNTLGEALTATRHALLESLPHINR